MVAPDRVWSMGQIELFDSLNWVQTNELFETKLFDHLTVCKPMFNWNVSDT